MQIQIKDGKSIWKQGWYVVGENRVYFRSKWEYKYACYLEYLLQFKQILKWQYEEDKFWFEKIKSGTRCYTPDFKITLLNGSIEYHEVKGYMDSKSKTKLNRMRIYYPDVKMRLIDKEWFFKSASLLKKIVPTNAI